jgi:hypothetical protein
MLNLDFSTERERERERERALLCSVLLGLDNFAQFLPKWQGVWQEQDNFLATGTVSVDSVGGSQKLEAPSLRSAFSRSVMPERQTTAYWDCRKKGQKLSGAWNKIPPGN